MPISDETRIDRNDYEGIEDYLENQFMYASWSYDGIRSRLHRFCVGFSNFGKQSNSKEAEIGIDTEGEDLFELSISARS